MGRPKTTLEQVVSHFEKHGTSVEEKLENLDERELQEVHEKLQDLEEKLILEKGN